MNSLLMTFVKIRFIFVPQPNKTFGSRFSSCQGQVTMGALLHSELNTI